MSAESIVIKSATPDTTGGTLKSPETPPAGTTVQGNDSRVTIHRDDDAAAQAKVEADAQAKLILGKFKDQAALETAYVELEKKQSTPVVPAAVKPAETVLPAVTQAGLDMDALNKEYIANAGKLSDTTLKALEAKGITAPMVEGYIGGLQAQATADRAELQSIVGGGPEDLQTLYEWAQTNLSKDEIAGYNALVSGRTRNIPAAKLVLDSMVNRYNAALGKDPNTPMVGAGAPAGAGGAVPFGDRSEMTTAMSDPRYKTSPAYRASVEARVLVTQF